MKPFDRWSRWLNRSPGAQRLLVGSPLRRPGPATATLGALCVALCAATLANVAMFATAPPAWLAVFVRGLSISTVLSIVPLAIVRFLDRREREEPWLVAVTFLWGALIATGLALLGNAVAFVAVETWLQTHEGIRSMLGEDAAILLTAPLAAPVVEELTKGLALLALFALVRGEFDSMRDGLVYGAIVGLGFNWFEAPLYVANGFAEDGVARWGLQFGVRYALFGLGGHALFSSLLGASLGLARQTPRRWVRLTAPLVGLVLAIQGHALHNAIPLVLVLAGADSPSETADPAAPPPGDVPFLEVWTGWSAASLVLFFPFFAVLVVALWRSGRWERHVIRSELQGEPPDIVAPEELAAAAQARIFRTRRIAGRRRSSSRALVNAQNELALRKWHVRRRGADPSEDAIAQGWRDEIRRIRASATAASTDQDPA